MKKMIVVMVVCAVGAFFVALGIEFALKRGQAAPRGAVTRPLPVPVKNAPPAAGTAAVSRTVDGETIAPADYEYDRKTGAKEYLR